MDEDAIEREARRRMVIEQLADRGIRDPRVLAAMEKVRRHLFIPPGFLHLAYADGPLPIGEGQTISQPYVVALMTQMLNLSGSERVLEIGTGSGYQAAVLSELAREVFSVERFESLAEQARRALAAAGCSNVRVFVADGSLGLPEYAPYDAIVFTAAAPRIPRTAVYQLRDGGRLIAPVGGEMGQVLELVVRRGERFRRKRLVPVAFVPLRGHEGWSEEDWHPV